MNARLRALVLSLSVIGLAACASMPERSAEAQKASVVRDYDQTYVAYVEQVARKRGVDVHWINPPQARKLQSGD
ncbi:hypothetical protein [Marilutibacter alkalisoli]|uniref:Uncharacterized protein n=1 Tax=Marilutibacter alkalisoli TaxID=2591633 RepID=A0A514BQC4_9GAMM|nr:hypothetical protein [Lysobacter alkalisoli]QDH69602.1 hypothetical protein FKV23_05490 [Lysobacter alkalisoli]